MLNHVKCLKDSINTFKNNFLVFVLGIILVMLISMLGITVFVAILGYFYLTKKAFDSERVRVNDIIRGTTKYLNQGFALFGIEVLLILLVGGVILFILKLELLFWILGLLITLIIYLACPVVVLKDFGTINSIKYATRLLFTKITDIVVMIILVGMLYITGSILFSVGLLITLPISLLYITKVVSNLE